MVSFDDAIRAHEFGGLGVYARAVLAAARDDQPEVVSLRLTVTTDSPGLSVVEVEFVDAGGMALGGVGL